MRYPHLFSRLYNTPLLLHPDKAAVIEAVFRRAMAGDLGADLHDGTPKPEAAFGRSAARTEKPYQMSDGGIAIIPVMGTLVQRASGLDAMSGLTSYARVAGLIDTALGDPDVRGILLELDSPGGEVSGLFDLADSIYAARAQKPVWTIANEQAYSAGYAIASSAEKLYMPRTAGVGSIGVIAMHVDQSKRDAAQGYTYTAIFAGAKKNDFNSHAPLSDTAAADLQAEIDRLYGMFVTTVARNRGIAADAVRGTEAGVLNPQQAVDGGFADGIATLSEVVAMMEAATQPKQVFSTTAHHATTRKETRMSQENAAASVSAEVHAAAVSQARLDGTKAGAQAERERIGAILQSDEAKGREAMAQTFALETEMDADTAKKLLSKSPQAATASATNPLASAMAGVANPKVGASAEATASDSPEAAAMTMAMNIINAGKQAAANK